MVQWEQKFLQLQVLDLIDVHGQIYHATSHLHPAKGEPRKFAQLYVLDCTQAVDKRLQIKENSGCLPLLMRKLDQLMKQINSFAEAFKMLSEVEDEEKKKALREHRAK